MTARWIEFRLSAEQAPKTSRWDVVSKDTGSVLGQVRWWGAWRRYAFFPAPNTLFEPTCLRDITAFLEEQTRARRTA